MDKVTDLNIGDEVSYEYLGNKFSAIVEGVIDKDRVLVQCLQPIPDSHFNSSYVFVNEKTGEMVKRIYRELFYDQIERGDYSND